MNILVTGGADHYITGHFGLNQIECFEKLCIP